MNYRAKVVLLGVVLAAILYVLISPLPELAATSSLQFPVFAAVLVLLLLGPVASPRLACLLRTPFLYERHGLLARSCVRLC